MDEEKKPDHWALTLVQMIAIALAILVACNMLLDPGRPPVPVCPASSETAPQ